MKEIFVKIAEFLQTQSEVKDIQFLDEAMGMMCYVTLADGQKLLLSLMDAKI